MTALFQHYLPPAPAMLPYVSGRFYASQHARAVGGAVAMTANRPFCVPYVLARPGLFSAMAVSVTTGGAGLLRMALAARGITPPRAFDLARELTARGGYVVQPGGAIRGLIYAPAAAWLREVPRLPAEVRVDVPAEAIPAMLRDGGMFIASVHPSIRRTGAEPPSRGGHLVLVFGAEGGALRFHNPSGDTVASQCDARLPVAEFARFYAGRGIAIGV